MKVLVTGASGFVGSALCGHLEAKSHTVRGAIRSTPRNLLPGVEYRSVSDMSIGANWSEALENAVERVVWDRGTSSFLMALPDCVRHFFDARRAARFGECHLASGRNLRLLFEDKRPGHFYERCSRWRSLPHGLLVATRQFLHCLNDVGLRSD